MDKVCSVSDRGTLVSGTRSPWVSFCWIWALVILGYVAAAEIVFLMLMAIAAFKEFC